LTSEPRCITVVPCTDKAVVTLPVEGSIQFINTTNNTKDNKINIGDLCWSVTAVKDKIYIGGEDKVIILNTEGTRIREIATHGDNYNLLYNERNDQLLLRQDRGLCCINLDGHVIYRYDISGFIMNSFVKSLLNVIPRGPSTPSCLLNTISRNVPSGDNLCMSCAPLMYT
jgi:hypothetical protein